MIGNVALEDKDGNAFKVDGFERTENGEIVVVQAVVNVDAETGNPTQFVSQETADFTNTLLTTVIQKQDEIKTLVNALNAKTTAVNTSAMQGIVELGTTSYDALSGVSQVITDRVPTPVISTPLSNEPAMPVKSVGQEITCASFVDVGASLMSPLMTQVAKSASVGVSQSGGNLVITTGTTPNSEALLRSTKFWSGSWITRFKFASSTRIANQNCIVMLADKLIDNANYSIDSPTSITVAWAGNFTSTAVGQKLFVGGFGGAAAGVPQLATIASIVPNVSITLTVAGFPAAGSGTVCLFGRNHIKVLYNGTNATASLFDTQRDGYNSGDTVIATNATNNVAGHIVQLHNDGRDVYVSDTLATSNTVTYRSSRIENIPDESVELYLYIWNFNGTGIPTASTTWTIGFWSVESFANLPVYIAGNKQQGTVAPLPVTLTNTPAININANQTVTLNPSATFGVATFHKLISAATTNATSVKASSGSIADMELYNPSASVVFLKLYNKASAPVVGTDIPFKTIPILPNSAVNQELANCWRFGTGIAYALTLGIADNDTQAVPAGVLINLSYV